MQDDAIELWLDRSRQLPATDPTGRESIISCGAALTNLQLAINYFGCEAWVQYVPDRDQPDLLARVRPGRSMVPGYSDELLFWSITQRRSVRRPFQDRPVQRDVQRRLIWKAMEYGCWLYFVESEPDREQIAQLVEKAHSWQLKDMGYQKERLDWMAPNDPLLQNGSGTSPTRSQTETVDDYAIAGKRWLERDRELLTKSPLMFVLGTPHDSIFEWIRAGEALQQILLLATAENVSASFLNQPCQIPELRTQLQYVTGRNGPPQLLLRLGYSTGVDPTSRRPVQDVIY